MPNRVPEDPGTKDARAEQRKDGQDVDRNKLAAHRGLATWGEKLVPLERFREATARSGRSLDPKARLEAAGQLTARRQDPTPVEGPFSRLAVFGGVYNNHRALEALLEKTRADRADALYCLGDFGGFGPNPDKVRPLLDRGNVLAIQGNYEESLSTGLEDCNCGYTDPRDNHFAELSYRYTAANTSEDFKRWMGSLPQRRRVCVGSHEFLMVHGSPRRINEFLFDSTAPDPFLEVLLDQEGADGLLFTHTGLHWQRRLPSGRYVANVGVIGRPANDGNTAVWYTLLEAIGDEISISHVPLEFDRAGLIDEMRLASLPEEFVETLATGWWTTCLEILPAKERAASRY